MKYLIETTNTPLAAFIKARYSAEVEFDTIIKTEENGVKRIAFVFKSNSIDFKNIEQIYLSSFSCSFFNELQNLRNLVRVMLP